MHMYRPSRKMTCKVLELVRNDERRGEAVVPRGEDGITPDATMLLFSIVNKKRAELYEQKVRYDLRELVHTYCERLPFSERTRRYAYELVIMRYYTLVSELRAEGRRVRKARKEARVATEATEPAPLA